MGDPTPGASERAVLGLPLEPGGPTPRLDRITRLARATLGTASAAVTVLDGDRAWFPSVAGAQSPTPLEREETLCSTASALDDVLLVPDAAADERFAGLRAVATGDVGFYAGHPLHDVSGNVVGVFCVHDPRPRRLDDEAMQTFLDLAAWAEHELVAPREMDQARRVQASLLPLRPVQHDGWEAAGQCLPALAVGGDFYDHELVDDELQVVLADVMGKGTGAALVGAGVRSAVRSTMPAVGVGVDLGVTTTQVARRLLSDLEQADSFVTLMHASVSTVDGTVRYVDAGAGLALLVRRDGTAVRLPSRDRPLGVLPEDHWTQHEDRLQPGDRLVLLSDGILDLVPADVPWEQSVASLVTGSVDVADLLSRVVQLTVSSTALDDVTVVAVFRGQAT